MAAEHNPHDLLSRVHVAKPCPADWKEMRGDLTVRHCTHCNKNVYNISRMTRAEAAKLIMDNEGKVCVRYYMRADGSVMTKDCPKIIVHRALFARVIVSAFALFGLLIGVAGNVAHSGDHKESKTNPITSLSDRLLAALGLSKADASSGIMGSIKVSLTPRATVGKIAVAVRHPAPAPSKPPKSGVTMGVPVHVITNRGEHKSK